MLLILASHLLQIPINLIRRLHKLIALSLLHKNSNVSTVDIGQDIIYSVTITNIGNVSATNVIFTDLIPDGTSFEPNSFTLNGTTIPNADLITGVPIGDIAPNQSVIVAFHINANEIPPINQLRIKLALAFNISLIQLIHQFQRIFLLTTLQQN